MKATPDQKAESERVRERYKLSRSLQSSWPAGETFFPQELEELLLDSSSKSSAIFESYNDALLENARLAVLENPLPWLEAMEEPTPAQATNAQLVRKRLTFAREFPVEFPDLASFGHLRILKGHEDTVFSVAWNPSGTRIVSGAWDYTLRIWESRLEDALPMWRAAAARRKSSD